MIPLLLRWIGAGLGRQPAFWALLLLSGAFVPLVHALHPWSDVSRLALAASLPAGVAGAALGLHAAGHNCNILNRASRGRRLALEAASLGAGALAAQLPLLPALGAGGASVLPMDLHLVALGTLALRFPLPDPWRPLLFATILLGAAGDWATTGRVGTLLGPAAPVLDVSRQIAPEAAFAPGPFAAWLQAGPIAGLLLASWLLLARADARAGFAPSR